MFLALFIFTVAITIISLLHFISRIIMSRSLFSREKASPFECGFNPLSSSRLPFSLQFFLLAIIFLVFDIEIALLLPVSFLSIQPTETTMFCMIMFIIILALGLFHEWHQGSLSWA